MILRLDTGIIDWMRRDAQAIVKPLSGWINEIVEPKEQHQPNFRSNLTSSKK